MWIIPYNEIDSQLIDDKIFKLIFIRSTIEVTTKDVCNTVFSIGVSHGDIYYTNILINNANKES